MKDDSSDVTDDIARELRFTLTLAIRHPSIDPEEISRLLARVPYQSWLAGAPRRTPTGRAMPSVARESYWVWISEVGAQRNFFAVLIEELDRLLPYADFLGRVAATGGRIALGVSLPGDVNIGARLPHDAVRRLAALPIDLDIEVFPDMP